MKVKELIDILSKLDPNSDIYFDVNDCIEGDYYVEIDEKGITEEEDSIQIKLFSSNF